MMFKRRVILASILVLFIVGCGTLNFGNTPWYLDIQNWSSYQRANFFMTTWIAELDSYNSMNAIQDKPEELVSVLKVKREILEKSRVPIRTYVGLVDSGSVPSNEMEQEIINFLRIYFIIAGLQQFHAFPFFIRRLTGFYPFQQLFRVGSHITLPSLYFLQYEIVIFVYRKL